MRTRSPRKAVGLRRLIAATILALMFGVAAGQGAPAKAGFPRALPSGTLPNDARLQPLKDLNGYFPFHPPASKEAWETRATALRRQLKVVLGLWPMPKRTPLNAVIHGRIEREEYTVEKVYFEGLPGFYVTGNLYRPRGRAKPSPGVLCPHGHWSGGRFYDCGATEVQELIAQGAEKYEEGGRSPLQSRCVGLARMGCVVFHYDMIGYADSVQISEKIAHGFSTQRPEMNRKEGWGLFSPQAESHFQSVMGLQTWNSIRALDFLSSLPDVDPKRLAVTGASGGGTQTFLLGAVDPRPVTAFPAVMVSTAMQGGCTCENASGLRVGTGNVEIAALFAPKPMGLSCADDWTKEMAVKGFPQLRELYALLGRPEDVMLQRGEQFAHNYNLPSREAMYGWFNRHLGLGLGDPILDRDYTRLTRSEMSVWDRDHPTPAGGPGFERELLRRLHADAQAELDAAAVDAERFRRLYGPAIEVVLGRTIEEVGEVELVLSESTDHGPYSRRTGSIRNRSHQEHLPVVILRSKAKATPSEIVIWITTRGKSGLYTTATDGGPALQPGILKLLRAGRSVVGVDLLFQGEFLADGQTVTRTRRVDNPREAAAYTFGYNSSLFARRVHDILTAVATVRERFGETKLSVVGLNGAGPWVAAARAVADGSIDRAIVDTGGFRFGRVGDLHEVSFLPGGAKYGDLPGLLALGAPGKVWIAGERRPAIDLVQRQYRLHRAENALTFWTGDPTLVTVAAVDWMIAD